ncbi:MAG: ParA family protein [Clostridia bacterium]
MKECKVIALSNQKGGVAKTTTTVNLGVGLAKEGNKVLLIDTDPQASLSLSLGVKNPDEIDYTLSSILKSVIFDEKIDISKGIIHHPEGVDLMPGNIELSGVEVMMTHCISRESILKEYVKQIKSQYDYILIDCPPTLGMLNINALAAAQSVIIPTQPHFLSTKGLELLLGSINKLKKQINPKLRIDGILVTMVNSRTRFSKDIIQVLHNSYGKKIKVFDTQIPFSIRAVESSSEGVSIYAFNKKGTVAQAYENFTKEVINIEKQRTKNRTQSVR